MRDITPVVCSVIIVLATVCTSVIVPYIKKKMSIDEINVLQHWVNVGVKMAEQLAKTGAITKEERKNKVLEFLHSKGYDIDFETIEALIESKVFELPPFANPDDDGVTAEKDDSDEEKEIV